MTETKDKKAVYDLAFSVYPHGEDLFSAKIMKMKEGRITEWKHGNGTTLGHAVAIAEGLLAAYAVCAHEVPAEQFYNDAIIV